MSLACRRREAVSLKRPWLLLVWDNIGGWDIVARARTRPAMMKKLHGEWKINGLDFAVVRLVRTSKAGPCDCDVHRERRRHYHPCIEKCRRRLACGNYECRKDTHPQWICRRCSWKRDRGKPPTEAEIRQYKMDERDDQLHG